MKLLSVEVIVKPIYKFKLIDTTIWHYALLLIYDNGVSLVVNWGPKIPLFNNNGTIRFEEFDAKIWKAPRAYFWRNNKSEGLETIKNRMSNMLLYIESHYKVSSKLPKSYATGLKYDWNDNNCEHFCSYIMYGIKMSSQYDVFDDG